MDHLCHSTSYLPMGQVDVLLHGKLLGNAIAAVEGDPFGDLVARVADAAIESHPDWVIEPCRRQDEEIQAQPAVEYLLSVSSRQQSLLRQMLEPAAILLACDGNESAKGVGDAHRGGDRTAEARPRRVVA
jgi:hypothetical protein